MRPEKMIPSDQCDQFDVLNNLDKVKEIKNSLEDLINSDQKRFYAASNECGIKERAIAIKFNSGIETFFNPICVDRLDSKLYREYDPITEKEYIIPRHTKATLGFYNEKGEQKVLQLSEDSAVIFEQAISVLDGVEDFVLGLEITDDYDKATEEEKVDLHEAYLKSLQELGVEFDKELSENEETKEQWNAYKFMEAINKGEVELMPNQQKQPNRKTRRLLDKLRRKKK